MQARTTSRQLLGRWLGVEPYYRVAERQSGRLRLVSRPEVLRRPGLALIGWGVALLLPALLIVASGLLATAEGGGFGPAALAAGVGGLLGGLGFQRIVGGYAVLSTHGALLVDWDAGRLTLTQGNRLAKERRQDLELRAIDGLRLRLRPVVVGRLLRRVRSTVALELLVGDQVWLIDSAADPAKIGETAAALSEVLGMRVETTAAPLAVGLSGDRPG